MKIAFTVFGSPVAQPRARARAVIAKGRMFARVYEPGNSTARQWKADVKQEAIKHKPTVLWDGPVTLALRFFLPRPKRLCRKKDPSHEIPCVTKPDFDNLAKSIVDALTGIIFHDDRQIYDVAVTKYYHSQSSGPRAEVMLEKDG